MYFCHDFEIGRKPHKLIILMLLGFKVRTGFMGLKSGCWQSCVLPGDWGGVRFPASRDRLIPWLAAPALVFKAQSFDPVSVLILPLSLCPSCLLKRTLMIPSAQDNPKIPNLSTLAKSLLLHRVTFTWDLGIRTWTPVGGRYSVSPRGNKLVKEGQRKILSEQDTWGAPWLF